MTREEEIQEKANELYYTHSPYEATIAMAKWADEHPRKGLVDIDKVCEWIENHHHEYSSWNTEEYELDFDTKKFINDFRKAMEDKV